MADYLVFSRNIISGNRISNRNSVCDLVLLITARGINSVAKVGYGYLVRFTDKVGENVCYCGRSYAGKVLGLTVINLGEISTGGNPYRARNDELQGFRFIYRQVIF